MIAKALLLIDGLYGTVVQTVVSNQPIFIWERRYVLRLQNPSVNFHETWNLQQSPLDAEFHLDATTKLVLMIEMEQMQWAEMCCLSFRGEWSTEGCEVVSVNSSTVSCSCNHLTNFAILFSLSPAVSPACCACLNNLLCFHSFTQCFTKPNPVIFWNKLLLCQ